MLKTEEKLSSTEDRIETIGSADLDEALTQTAYGRFHYIIMACSALCLLSTGLHYGLPAYVLPAASCELSLTSSDIGLINAAFLIGGTCSSFLWGVVADLTGRRKVIMLTLLLDVFATICCSLVQGFLGLFICRFINGFLIGAPGSITYSYLAEFHAPRHRSKSVYFSGIFDTLSWLILPTLARYILPLDIELKLLDFTIFTPWRLFVLILIIPEIAAGIWLWYLPESPKFLAIKKPELALGVVRKMFCANTGRNENEFPVKSLNGNIMVDNYEQNQISCGAKTLKVLRDVYSQISKLLQSSLIFPTLLVCGIMFANMFGYFGMGLWLPELLKQNQNMQNATVIQNSTTCSSDFDNSLYLTTMIIAATTLVGNIMSALLAGKLEINIIPLISMLFGGLSTVSFYWLTSTYQFIIAASIFQATMAIANIAVGSLIVELFPTSVNAVAISASMFSGRFGAIVCNIIFGCLMEMHSEIAIFLVAGVLLVGAAMCFFIPKQKPEQLQSIEINLETYRKKE